MDGMHPRRGFNLLELVVCLVIITGCIMLILGLLPSSLIGLRHAEQVEDATLYATVAMESLQQQLDLYGPTYFAKLPSPVQVPWRGQNYTVSWDVTPSTNPVDTAPQLQTFQVGVTMAWEGESVPIRVATFHQWYQP